MAAPAIITREELINRYLVGLNLTDDYGQEFPDELYTFAIEVATAWLATALDIDLLPVEFYGKDDDDRLQNEEDDEGRFGAERHDFYSPDAFMSLKLKRRPLRGSPTEIRLRYPGVTEPVLTVPKDWIVVTDPLCGRVEVVPAVGSVTSITGGGTPFVYGKHYGFLPGALRVDYKAGFAPGKVPADIKHLLFLVASMNALNPAGDLIAGAGVASLSLSMAGLAQSLSTTSSATNAGFGSRIIQYAKDLKTMLPTIRSKYHGPSLAVA